MIFYACMKIIINHTNSCLTSDMGIFELGVLHVTNGLINIPSYLTQ